MTKTASGRPAARVLKELGIACLLAESINGLFFRNCVNYGFPALEVPGVHDAFAEGDRAEIDFVAGTVRNARTGRTLTGHRWPDPLYRRQRAVQDVIPPLELPGPLERQHVERLFDHTNQPVAPGRLGADRTRVCFGDVEAHGAEAGAFLQLDQRLGQIARLLPIPAQ